MEQFGNIKLYNADCMEVMKTFKDKQFSLAIVDPPYGIGAGGKNFKSGTSSNTKIYRDIDWDSGIPSKEYFEELKRVSKNQIVWGGNYFFEHLGNCRCFIFWDKNQPMDNYADGELAWTSFDKVAKKYNKNWFGGLAKEKNQRQRIHPTQKPVQLYKWLLQNYAKEGDTILDTHFGSLSIGIACHDMKFDLTAIELDKDYYEQAKQRLINHQRQLTLF